MDVTRCLKAKSAKNVFFWTKFGDFCTILRESHQSQFFLATYKKQHFSAKIEYFWLKMDVIRCLKAKIAKNVFILTKFGDFCTILRESHQSQFFLATYKSLHFLAKNDQFLLGMDVTRWLKAEIAKKVFTSLIFLVIIALFYMRVTKVSSFWPPKKSSIFRRKMSVFGQEWMLLGGWRLKLPKMCSL